MNPHLKTAVRHYLLGLFSAMWNGGVSAVAVILGIGGAAVSGVVEVEALDLGQMLSAFAGAAVVHGVFWLKSHPLPENWSGLFKPPTAPVVPPKPPTP